MKIRAHELAKEQREISIAEFFTKNRHLLGFDNKIRALLTTIKELVDNSLDATDDMRVLPEITVRIDQLSEDRFKVSVEDNGPGIVKEQIPRIFAKLLYGSKFFKIKESRGQQGIGVSASVLYSQLTTGKSTTITSKIDPKHKAHRYQLHIDAARNEPEIVKEEIIDWKEKNHGTKVELELEAEYLKGKRSVDEYIKETAMVNPHLRMVYYSPDKKRTVFSRVTQELPIEPKAIRPHPYGIELGKLIQMLKSSKHAKLKSFLTNEFCRVTPKVADEIIIKAGLGSNALSKRIARQEAENLLKSIKDTKIMAPPLNCLSPISSELLEQGLKKEVKAEFYTTITRPPSVYRGFPFLVEAGICYGGEIKEGQVRIMRFANKVPLLYQQSAGAISKSIAQTGWKSYGLQQSGSNLPVGPAIIVVHIASVWVPFTSESKEAIAHYPEIVKEIKLAIQECGRQLSRYVNRKAKKDDALKKKSYIEKYLPYVGEALGEILNLQKKDEEKVKKVLKDVLERSRGM